MFIKDCKYKIPEKEILSKVDSIKALSIWCDLITK